MVTFRVSRRDLAWAAGLVLLLVTVWVARSDTAEAGLSDPQGVDIVYVAVSTNFPDALGVGAGAGLYGAPVILVPTDPPLPGVTQTELLRLDPHTVIIVGGTGAISTGVEDAIGDLLPGATIERLAGSNRYATNTLFTESVFPYEGWTSVSMAGWTADDPADVVMDLGSSVYGTGNATLYANLTLPHGADILGFEVSGSDTDASIGGPLLGHDVKVTVVRYNNAGFGDDETCGSNSSGGGGDFVDSCEFGGPMKVDNQNWAYYVYVQGADGDPVVYTVNIHYRLGAPTADVISGP